jgi:hypothetical protein
MSTTIRRRAPLTAVVDMSQTINNIIVRVAARRGSEQSQFVDPEGMKG